VFKRFGHILLICALLAASGSHWVILQSVAWTGMLAENLQSNSFQEAILKTFDGKHPCCLCKEIAKGKQSEKKADFSVDLKRLEFCYDSTAVVFTAPAFFWITDSIQNPICQLSHAPPTPPPRLA
jgi:hypothetical protein